MVLLQHMGLLKILGEAESTLKRSRCTEPSGESSPTQVILSPGSNDLSSLLTGPPSRKATRLRGRPSENTEIEAWPPFDSLGLEMTEPESTDSMWSSLIWFERWIA